jgi:hypothetical protein
MSEFLASPIGVLALTVAKALALLVPLLVRTWKEHRRG